MKLNYKPAGFFALLLAALGITSACGDIDSGLNKREDMRMMYGTPTAEYSIKGKVVDKDNNPLDGVQVAVGGVLDYKPGVLYDRNYYPLDTVYSDGSGKFVFARKSFPYNKIQLDFKDLKLAKFNDQKVLVDIEFKGGDGSWFSGTADVSMKDVVLSEDE